MDRVTQLKEQLAATMSELHELSTTSYSQSNAGHMLAVRSLRQRKMRLEGSLALAQAQALVHQTSKSDSEKGILDLGK